MAERLKVFEPDGEVTTFWQKNEQGMLSGRVFASKGVLVTASHVVESIPSVFHGFDMFPHPDNREIDIAIKRDPSITGPELGFTTETVLRDCLCITSRADDPEKILYIPGSFVPFVEPTYLSEFVPDKDEDRASFEPGCSGSVVLYKNKIVGLIKASNDSRSIIVGLCFSFAPLREELIDYFGLNFSFIDES